jgi:Divergent InlB B-repeat domain
VLTATLPSGWGVKEWKGVSCEGGNKSTTCKFAMPAAPTKVEVETEATHEQPLTVYITGKGTVESSWITNPLVCSGSGEECAQEAEGTVTLTGHPGAGYVLAGWIGCKKASSKTCTVEMTRAREVTAVFLLEGKEGIQGPIGPAGPEGPEGKQGTPGKTGATGANGANGAGGEKGAGGANGAAGAQGPAGPAGAAGPAGPAGKVTCKVQQKGKKVKVTCTVKAAKASAARVHWRLSRHGHALAHGASKGANVRLDASGLPAGRYTLTIITGSGKHASIRSESFTLR